MTEFDPNADPKPQFIAAVKERIDELEESIQWSIGAMARNFDGEVEIYADRYFPDRYYIEATASAKRTLKELRFWKDILHYYEGEE